MTVLLTGGTGFIGSHTAVELMGSGHDVVVADDLSNSRETVLDGIEEVTGRRPAFYHCDVRDGEQLDKIFQKHPVSSVIHFAGLKSVADSVERPLEYYSHNIGSATAIIRAMKEHGVTRFLFSSSALVYGMDASSPCMETMEAGNCANPYAWSKYMIEQILLDEAAANSGLSVAILRYFNPAGAHETGLIGEDPRGIPNNLMPIVNRVASGEMDRLTVFGNDYDTPDGTCRRDYIHVMDLAAGHAKAMDYMEGRTGVEIFNLGTGRPYSVLEMIRTFESCNGVEVPFEIGERRSGDPAQFWADVNKAKTVLGWEAKRSLEDMCRDSWRWMNNA